MRIGIAVIIRLGSKRLRDKHLLHCGEHTMLEILTRRVKRVRVNGCDLSVYLCSGLSGVNDPLKELSEQYGIGFFRGDDQHIPRRLFQFTSSCNLDAVVSVDGDDILVAIESIEASIKKLIQGSQYVTSSGWPFGMNVSAYHSDFLKSYEKNWPVEQLETGWGKAFSESSADVVLSDCDYSAFSHHRYTLDYEEDVLFFRRLESEFGKNLFDTSTQEITARVEQLKLYEINRTVDEKYWENYSTEMKLQDNENLRNRLHSVIPGGCHTYSRGDDQFSKVVPALFDRGEGCYLFDHNGDRWVDFGMGLRSVNVGYGHPEICEAFYQEALKGNNLTRASYTELIAAERLADLIPSVDMVKFAKHGSTVTTAACKLARAYTGRLRIAVPEEQPFFSFDDWFIGTTPMNKGTLEASSSRTHKFKYGNIESLKQLLDEYPGEFAAVMMEPATHLSPCKCEGSVYSNCLSCGNQSKNFLHQVKQLAHQNGALFILDEMITGFRWHLKGAQFFYGVEPDLCTFGKAMANGFAVAALAGKREVMSLGDILKPNAERVFLTSTTHGAEMGSLGAFLKTLDILERDKVIEQNWNMGSKLKEGIERLAHNFNLEKNFEITGYGCSPLYIWRDNEGAVSLPLRSLFLQETAKRKLLIPYISPSFAHTSEIVDWALAVIEEILPIMQQATEEGTEKLLSDNVVKPVFRKFN
jgi:glutamate-1-semialdehyde 2,1-aminomutase